MILHVYHCSHAVITDYKSAPGRNRPDGTGRDPSRPKQADVSYLPPTDAFDDPMLSRLLELFTSIDLADSKHSPIRLNWRYLEERLGVARSEIRGLLQQADRRSLLRRLTIAYDYEQWLKQSSEKGCLVIMTCVEHTDLTRDPAEVADAYGETVDAIKRSVLNGQQRLDRVIVVPNGHLAPRTAPVPWEQALALLREIPPALEKRGYEPTLNSYGFSKIIRLAIHAHKLGYVLRVV